jgi:hypothetical protein
MTSLGFLAVSHDLNQTSRVQAWQRAELMHADAARGCDSPLPLGHRQADQLCTWRVVHAKGSVVLLGDSNAGHFTEPVVAAFVALRVTGSFSGEGPCRTFVAGTLSELLRHPPSLVILAARTDVYIGASSSALGALPNGALSNSPTRKAQLWEHGLDVVLSELRRARIPTIVVSPIPTVPVEPSGCAMLLVITNSCGGTVSQAKVDQELRRSIEAERQAVEATPGALRLDFEHDFCRHGECSSTRGDRYAYRNSDHLSVEGALSLTGEFERAIRGRAIPRS